MADPNFLSDGQSERVDSLVDSAGGAHYKQSVPNTEAAVTGSSNTTAPLRVGTHNNGDTLDGTIDPVVLAAGKDAYGDAHAVLLDGYGRVQTADRADSPPVVSVSGLTAGSLSAGTYYYQVSSVTPWGESGASNAVSVAVGATSRVWITWTAVPGAIGYRVYGRSSGSELFMQYVDAQVATGSGWIDDGSVTPSGASVVGYGARKADADPLVDSAGAAYFRSPVGSGTAITKHADKTAPQQVGTHVKAATIASTDPVAVVAGSTAGNAATPMLVDSSGNQYVRAAAPTDLTILASGARTTTQTGSDQSSAGYRGVKVVLDVTTPGTGSITLTIQAKDAASGKYYTLLAGAAVTTTTTNVYTVYPTITAVSNVIAQDVLTSTWRVLVTANNANSMTYSVGAALLP